ncbi:hypothetical protein Taro_026662, partial [Colocasia esculenta]|nr:hypothetical protein [Colocasia esculenta]
LAGAPSPSFGFSPSFSSLRSRSSPSPPPAVRAWRSGDGSCGAVERRVERGGGGHGVVKALRGFGSSFSVSLPADVATAEHVVTSEKASPQSDATLPVQGGSACGPSTWWRFEVAVVVLLLHVFDSAGSAVVIFGLTRVVVEAFLFPAALAGRDSLSQEFVAGRLWWRFVAPCVASSVSCERESSLYRELRVSFLQVLGLLEFIAYLTGLNSNPSESSDLWVAEQPSGVPGRESVRSGRYRPRLLSSPQRELL